MKFSEKIRKARIDAKFSQKELADKTGLALRTVQNYEIGGRYPKKRETYRILAEVLHVDISCLLDDETDFLVATGERYGERGRKQAERLVEEVSGMFAGGELEEEDSDAMMQALMDAYWAAKKKNRKYIPRKYMNDTEDETPDQAEPGGHEGVSEDD